MTLQHPNPTPTQEEYHQEGTPGTIGSAYPATVNRDHVLTDGSVVRTNPDGTTAHLTREQVAKEVADDDSEFPPGWSVSDLGKEGFLVSHDGRNDTGTYGAGQSHKVTKVGDIPLVIQHNGRIPE